MIFKIDITLHSLANEVLALQYESYQVEADIIGYGELPPLKDDVISLQNSGERFFGFYEKDQLCGAVSFKLEKNIVDIHRLMVHPRHFRKGISKALLHHLEGEFKGMDAIVVSTGTKNRPAIHLYKNAGFKEVEEQEITEGLRITTFKKMLK
ncbi:GNAT family N-acetyltransferase [Rossellomorea aquimaris]|jgi:ribosomal protein S18 acetylase RimI-like enzyme|uniref:GNAT family N-acetyltransferase n=1 Tax=Rossellomorea aquimaris TaxID=189382 RepID=A0A1J6WUS8_9BACI|nr:GNAT family N-acetyltransferase [Rossellomorea aquimaris]OIU71979.1 GNAT family N-acetyltransferase [Rossellomorea aquimaris]